MFDTLEVMRMAHGLASHASARQELVARNVANADTPGFRAQDLKPFEQLYRAADRRDFAMRATRPGHVDAMTHSVAAAQGVDVGGATAPNGNNVSVESEMMRAAEIRHQHDMATSIYKTSMDVLRASLGRGR